MAVPGLLPGRLWEGVGVLDDEVRELAGRVGKADLADGPTALATTCSSSLFSCGVPASLRAESTDGGRPAPEPMRLVESVVV